MNERGGFTSWQEKVMASLADSKRRGLTWDQAWRRATTDHPPRLMDQGRAVPQLDDEITVLDFFRDSARTAWRGEKAELKDLPDAIRDMGRYWTPTPRVGGRIGNWR